VKSATLVTTLTGLTTAMAVAAPIVVFGFLFVLQVYPERQAAAESRHRLTAAREELNRQQQLVRPQSGSPDASALAAFEARISKSGGASDAADMLTAVLNSPEVGGVSNIAVETGAPKDAESGSTARLFSQTVKQTLVTVTFDARYQQIEQFFRNLRVLPTIFELQSAELMPGRAPGSGMMRAKVSLLVFHRPGTSTPVSATQAIDVITPAHQNREPIAKAARLEGRGPAVAKEPDPVVTSILLSSGRRAAIVDGRIVRAGDQVRAGIIREIVADGVVIVGPDGRERRVAIARPVPPAVKR
jgi:hypothetical protein